MIPKPITKSGASLLPTSLVKDVPHASRGTSAAMVATRFYRTGDYLALTKPRVMSLVVFTAAVGDSCRTGSPGPPFRPWGKFVYPARRRGRGGTDQAG